MLTQFLKVESLHLILFINIKFGKTHTLLNHSKMKKYTDSNGDVCPADPKKTSAKIVSHCDGWPRIWSIPGSGDT